MRSCAAASTSWGCAPTSDPPLGVYVHIPFCARRCDYCAFATWTDRHHLMASYARACIAELEAAELTPASSVFFGGGTPSLLPHGLLTSILAAIDRGPDAEVTVECNPETVTPALLAAYRAAGVSRLSFGVQSMVPAVLAALGRQHDPGAVVRAVAWARAEGFESFNLDLIYGGAGESVTDWRRSLDEVIALEPTHVSAYALTIEAGTPLALDAARHPDDDDQATKYELANEVLGDAGFEWYEISNWARPGHECRHNLLYWSQGDYRGIGCAAHSHSFVDRRRWWNMRTPDRYVAAIESGSVGAHVGGHETLSPDEQGLEGLQLALRTRRGCPAAALDPDRLPSLVEAGLVEVVGQRAVLTVTGRLLANEVALALRPAASAGALVAG